MARAARDEHGGILDGSTLEAWVARAEALLTEAGRGKIGRHCIGQALAGRTTDDDGTWPSAPVRQVLEARADPDLESPSSTQEPHSRDMPAMRGPTSTHQTTGTPSTSSTTASTELPSCM